MYAVCIIWWEEELATVEAHFGETASVLISEVVLFLEVKNIIINAMVKDLEECPL